MRKKKSRIASAAAVAETRERGEVFCCPCCGRRRQRSYCTRESPQKFTHLSHTSTYTASRERGE